MLVARSGRKQFQQDRAIEYMEYLRTMTLPATIRVKVGDIIHLKTRNGVYRIIRVNRETITITCDAWIKQHRSGLRKAAECNIHISSIKCKYGQGLSRTSINNIEIRK